MYTVFHRNELYFPSIHSDRPVPNDLGWPRNYHVVAQVTGDAGCPELAYTATQHIDRAWWDNPYVQRLPIHRQVWPGRKNPNKYRSTSVGDVIADERDLWVVADIGFVYLMRLQRGDIVTFLGVNNGFLGEGMILSATKRDGLYVVTTTGSYNIAPHAAHFQKRLGLHTRARLLDLWEEENTPPWMR